MNIDELMAGMKTISDQHAELAAENAKLKDIIKKMSAERKELNERLAKMDEIRKGVCALNELLVQK